MILSIYEDSLPVPITTNNRTKSHDGAVARYVALAVQLVIGRTFSQR
jgi:hypothetical protein